MVPLKRISRAVGVLALIAASTLAQTPAPGRNQATADQVAASLRTSAGLGGSRVDIETREGLVTLTGVVASPALKAEAVRLAGTSAGVVGVIDKLKIAPDARVRPAQYQPQMGPVRQPAQVAMGGGNGIFHRNRGGAVAETGEAMAAPAGPAYDGGPVPEGPAGSGGTQAVSPNQPNYAWPSTAPYPNFSAVGYPTAYPWQAWPNIGPFYPYPEVPQDWRAVTMRWDDGIWWLDFRKHYTRPFFTPYPFGIFGY